MLEKNRDDLKLGPHFRVKVEALHLAPDILDLLSMTLETPHTVQCIRFQFVYLLFNDLTEKTA